MLVKGSQVGRFNRVVLISSAVSHALAWIVYLVVVFGLVIWPAWQSGNGEDSRVLATVFGPVALSGLGWLTVLVHGRWAGGKPMSIVFAVLLTVFCSLAILSVIFIYLPASAKLGVGIIVGFYPIILTLGVGQRSRSFLLGITAISLLGFSVLAIFSVGIFFLPTALAMMVAALASLVSRPPLLTG